VRERWRAGIWAGWSSRGETRRRARWLARWSRGGGREIRREDGFESSFKGEHCSVEERERESRHRAGLRSTGGADVPFGCAWRPLGTGGPTWQDEGRLAEAARAVGEAARRHVGRKEGGAGLRQAREMAGGGGSRARGRDRGDRGERGR
jgi:hypothetical protein